MRVLLGRERENTCHLEFRYAYLAIDFVPEGADHDTYLVLDNFGRIGCSWRETDADNADHVTLIRDLVEGQYSHPVRIVAFNAAEG